MSERGSGRTLKQANFVWLCTISTFDAVVLAVLLFPNIIASMNISSAAILRGLSGALLPVVPLLLTNTVSPDMKARLVFWRWRFPLPGSRAFSKHALEDSRVNLEKLQKYVGAFPVEPDRQNALWYSLYLKVKVEAAVIDAHKAFLLYRDVASLSVSLLVLSAGGLWALGFSHAEIDMAIAVFGAQYLISMISARSAGQRFVGTVLAIHSTRKIPNPK